MGFGCEHSEKSFNYAWLGAGSTELAAHFLKKTVRWPWVSKFTVKIMNGVLAPIHYYLTMRR